ncbi:unnamed protein product [Ostreobium quekettii]|uniref:Vps72/YL1 C-terminal domain-containing protein n=1 Tax=Ostreobium quekettii TaxID=121088 RepID=A0A8S1IVM8_9CHLO|nr:unnamed protein product [Ostreobium quekettii]
MAEVTSKGLEGEKAATPPPRTGPQQPEFCAEDWFLPSVLPFKVKDHAKDKKKYWKRLKQIVAGENYDELPPGEPTYANIEAGPSIYPAKKYCDLTGFEAPYTDPKTKMRYATADLYPLVRSLPNDEVQTRLAVRNAHTVLR